MSTVSLFYVALTMVAAAAALPIVATPGSSLDARIDAPQGSATSSTSPQRPELQSQMSSLRDMHERLSAAGSVADRRALMAESDRVMSDGVGLMRQLKQGLGSAVAESGEVRSAYVTQDVSDKISAYLGLMELLIQLKGDREATTGPAAPTTEAGPSANASLSSAAPAGTWRGLERIDAVI